MAKQQVVDGKLQVICEDLTTHPFCPHGPTLLFSRTRSTTEEPDLLYACSACRSKKDCPVHISKEKYTHSTEKANEIEKKHLKLGKRKSVLRERILAAKPKHRRYCHECCTLFSKKDEEAEAHADHDVLVRISDDDMKQPSRLLHPTTDEKTQAQFFFTEKTLDALIGILQKLGIRKVVCLGAPRLHEHLVANPNGVQSYLMDIDKRYLDFFGDKEFAWFNMLNDYFFLGNLQREFFEEFLKEDGETKVLLFVDPPFGCRTEPLTHTIKEITSTYRRVNSPDLKVLPIFWIFPYYMEIYLKNSMPEMEMCEYKIDYTNHSSYTDEKETGRKFGSVVRIFTNVPLRLIELPASEGYRLCTLCERWVAAENQHCRLCRGCPSKNGQMYRHCLLCATCVKPNYVHCRTCGRCTQVKEHSCQEYQASTICWICRKRGHCEKKCKAWKNAARKMGRDPNMSGVKEGKRRCLICCKVGHSEKRCSQRQNILKEFTFLSKVSSIFD